VDFVPCYRIKPSETLKSSTDRTPLHTQYLEGMLKPMHRDEIRLLKRFMEGIGVYGAEIKTHGFSGYLCELLTIHHHTFTNTLKTASKWKEPTVIQFNEPQEERRLLKRFKNPLIVLDPVDPTRNVASAVSRQSYWTFVAAARAFTQQPSPKFFYPPSHETAPEEVMELLHAPITDILFLVIPDDKRHVPDILYGQLQKTQEALTKLLKEKGFIPLRAEVWSDEESLHIQIIELAASKIPPSVKHKGPPVKMWEESRNFITQHLHDPETIRGPSIMENRWAVIKKREHCDARHLIREYLSDGGKDIGISKKISKIIKQGYHLLLNQEIQPHLNGTFTQTLYKFLKGRPDWID
jgi:tRNA nucleotidyltransferase (CCA-adding enzyme)